MLKKFALCSYLLFGTVLVTSCTETEQVTITQEENTAGKPITKAIEEDKPDETNTDALIQKYIENLSQEELQKYQDEVKKEQEEYKLSQESKETKKFYKKMEQIIKENTKLKAQIPQEPTTIWEKTKAYTYNYRGTLAIIGTATAAYLAHRYFTQENEDPERKEALKKAQTKIQAQKDKIIALEKQITKLQQPNTPRSWWQKARSFIKK